MKGLKMKKSIFSALFGALLCCKSVFAEGLQTETKIL